MQESSIQTNVLPRSQTVLPQRTLDRLCFLRRARRPVIDRGIQGLACLELGKVCISRRSVATDALRHAILRETGESSGMDQMDTTERFGISLLCDLVITNLLLPLPPILAATRMHLYM